MFTMTTQLMKIILSGEKIDVDVEILFLVKFWLFFA
jgi:hypothetical protein